MNKTYKELEGETLKYVDLVKHYEDMKFEVENLSMGDGSFGQVTFYNSRIEVLVRFHFEIINIYDVTIEIIEGEVL